MVLGRAPNGNVSNVTEAKIAVFTCSIAPPDTETKGTVLIETAEELTNFNKSEENEIEALIKSIADSGVKVLVSGSSIDDLALHFIEKFGMMAITLPSKFELRRLCRAVGARPLVSLGPVSPEYQGFCQRVYVKELGLKKCIVFEQGENDKSGIATILLRASTHNILNDVERAIDDGVNVVKAMGKFSPARFTPGAGATELELARLVAEEGAKAAGLDQYAIKAFAEALEVVPRTLAENAGLDAMDTISALYSAHAKGLTQAGVDITAKRAAEAIVEETKVLDLLATKRQALVLCVDAVTTILRVDQIIMAKPAGGPRVPKPNNNFDA
jgi:T-complex protein 1 subunit theta